MIIDANVAIKWTIPEPDSALAETLLSRADLAAPSSLLVEVAHVLTKQARDRAISEEQARTGLAFLNDNALRYVPFETIYEEAIDLALRFHATTYDCLYLALAIAEDDILVTADARFARAISRDPVFAKRVTLLSDAV